jgi:hypothetical protein
MVETGIVVVAMDATFWKWMLQCKLRGELARGYVVLHGINYLDVSDCH